MAALPESMAAHQCVIAEAGKELSEIGLQPPLRKWPNKQVHV
jgi:hypothetical protein